MPAALPSLLEPEYAPVYSAWKADPSPEGNATALKALHPVIEGAVRAHVGQVNPLALGQGRLLALSGLRSYEPARGKLKTHLYNHLQGLRRLNRQQTQAVRVPERLGLERQGLAEAEQNMTHELGREPTDAELTDHLGVSRARLSRLRAAHSGLAEGTLEATPDGSFDQLHPLGPQRDMWHELVYDDSPPIDQKIMELAMGLHGQQVLPNHMIAKRLRLSAGAISQRKQKIQQRLDQGTELSPF